MISLRGLFPILGIAAAALFSSWLYHQSTLQKAASDARQRHDPDAYITDFDLSTLDAQGQLKHRLWAQRMLHYPDDDSTELSAPYMELYRPDKPTWKLRAERGWVSRGGNEIRLRDQVEIHRPAALGLRPADITTSKLDAFPERDLVETDAEITYRSTGLEVKSVGMRAYLDQGRVELLSRVRATHQPQRKR